MQARRPLTAHGQWAQGGQTRVARVQKANSASQAGTFILSKHGCGLRGDRAPRDWPCNGWAQRRVAPGTPSMPGPGAWLRGRPESCSFFREGAQSPALCPGEEDKEPGPARGRPTSEPRPPQPGGSAGAATGPQQPNTRLPKRKHAILATSVQFPRCWKMASFPSEHWECQ